VDQPAGHGPGFYYAAGRPALLLSALRRRMFGKIAGTSSPRRRASTSRV